MRYAGGLGNIHKHAACAVLCGGVLCAAFGARADGGAAGPDPGLENNGKGWRIPDNGNFAIRDGAGRNGSRGLVWTGVNTNNYGFAQYAVPFRPGQSLKISIWIKDDGLSDKRPGFCVEFFGGKSGRDYLTGVGSKVAPNQPKGVGVWRKYEAFTGPIQPATCRCSVDIFGNKGVTGSCVFDDVEVETVGINTDALFYSSAPDDKAVSGKVRLSVVTYADLKAYPTQNVETVFTARGKGGFFTFKPETFECGRAEGWLDVDKLAPGANIIRFTVTAKDAEGKKTKLDERRLSFTRLAAPVKSRVWFDEHRRFVIDGKVTYPLLCYLSDDKEHADKRMMPAIDRSPFKLFMSYDRYTTKEKLDFYHARGIKTFVSYCSAWAFDWNPPREIGEWWDETAFVADQINTLKDHPAILGWYPADEPNEARMPRCRERYKLVKALDPTRPVLNVLCHGRQARETMATCDVVGLDCYPVQDRGTEETLPANLATVTHAMKAATGGMRGDKPLWFVPQAYPQCGLRARFPTFREMRSMVWQGIAGGADGVLFYSLGELLGNKDKGGYNFVDAWDITCRVAQEIRDREDMLLTIEPAPVLKDLPKGVVARAWRKDGKTLLVVVNITHKPIAGKLTMDGATVSFDLGKDEVKFF